MLGFQFALAGGPPTFPVPLHVGRPNIPPKSRVMARLEEVLDSRWLTNNGPQVIEFESAICSLVGSRHCVATANGTVALEILIRATELVGEVIVPSYTFIATAHALACQGIRPVFCDIEEKTHTLDPRAVREAVTPHTSGILGVHLWGNPCDVEALQKIANEHGLALLFDASHAFLCTRKGAWIGNFGRGEVFSFHATKFLNSFEGGAVCTNDDDLADRLCYLRNFGFRWYDDVAWMGTNAKMSEPCAAMGLCSLEYRHEVIKANYENYQTYQRELERVRGCRMLRYDEHETNNFQYIVMEVDAAAAQLARDELLLVLWAENVLARRYFWPGCHAMEAYRRAHPDADALLPKTLEVAKRVLVLPTGTTVAEEDVVKICRIIRAAVEQAAEVKRIVRSHPKAQQVRAQALGELDSHRKA